MTTMNPTEAIRIARDCLAKSGGVSLVNARAHAMDMRDVDAGERADAYNELARIHGAVEALTPQIDGNIRAMNDAPVTRAEMVTMVRQIVSDAIRMNDTRRLR